MNNQMQISAPGSGPIVDVGLIPLAPAPNGDEMVNRHEDDGNFECVLHSSSVQSFSQ